MFDLDQFVADLRATLPQRSRQAMREVVARAVADPAAVCKVIGEPQKSGINVLYASPELTVINLIWGPNQITLPHNHLLAAAIGMYGGREDNLFWRRVPNPTRYQIEAAGGEALGTGDATLLGRDIIHSVINPLGKLSGAIHVYDGDFLHIERSMWDAETLTEEPYDVAKLSPGLTVSMR